MDQNEELTGKLLKLKEEKNAVILAHNYQLPEVQDVADYVGDSLGLSRQAAATDADIIVFCGVKFMAESAKILSPEKTVLLPEIEAGCPMAEMVDVEALRVKKKEYPEATVVTYVNSSAAVKAESDYCCTSSNALAVVEAIDNNQILFAPDMNLGQYVAQQTNKKIIIWDGYCITHNRVQVEEVKKVREKYPDAPILIHPECPPEVVKMADYVGSTAGILKQAKESEAKTLIIGTEKGLIHRLQKENPEKKFYLLSSHLICTNMKKINLQKVVKSLEKMETEIELDENIRMKASQALERMIEITS